MGAAPLVLFKGAGFDFSAASALFLCAILCGAFTGAETFISSPSVVIGAEREDPRVTPARGAATRPLEADGEVNSPLQRLRSYRGAPAHHRKLTGLDRPV